MNLDELQSVLSGERRTDTHQELRDSFYREAGEFVQELREERDRAAERADDPFDSPEVSRLTDDIDTAERTVESIYERRVGKLVKMASFAAADMPTDDEGLTAEERALFETLVDAIEENREHVLDVLAGEAEGGPPSMDRAAGDGTAAEGTTGDPASGDHPPGSATDRSDDRERVPPDPASSAGAGPGSTPEPETLGNDAPGTSPGADSPTTVDAADLMGRDDDPEAGDDEGRSGSQDGEHGGSTDRVETPDGGTATDGTYADREDVERTTVKITRDVGEILGVDEREYDLKREDVVTLPEDNAEPLLERDAAERLE